MWTPIVSSADSSSRPDISWDYVFSTNYKIPSTYYHHTSIFDQFQTKTYRRGCTIRSIVSEASCYQVFGSFRSFRSFGSFGSFGLKWLDFIWIQLDFYIQLKHWSPNSAQFVLPTAWVPWPVSPNCILKSAAQFHLSLHIWVENGSNCSNGILNTLSALYQRCWRWKLSLQNNTFKILHALWNCCCR